MSESKGNSEKNKKKVDHTIDAVTGVASGEVIDRFGNAAVELVKGYQGTLDEAGQVVAKGLRQIAESKVHSDFQYQNLKQQAGFSAERHYVDQQNVENIINRKSVRYQTSNAVGMGNDQRIDVLAVDLDGNPILDVNHKPLWSAQVKFCGDYQSAEEVLRSSEKLAKQLAGEKWAKYRGNHVLVPSEQYEHIKQFASEEATKLREQAAKFRLTGDIDKANLLDDKAANFDQVSRDVQDSGISSKEAMFLRNHPELATIGKVLHTSHRAGLEQAKIGAMFGAAISVSQNVIELMRGNKKFSEAAIDSVKGTAGAAATSYVIAASGTAIKGFMSASSNSIVKSLSQTNMPALIANATIQVGKSIVRFVNGEINALEFVEEIGEKGTGMVAASWGAAAGSAIGTLILPGIGTLVGGAVGGMIGYLTSSILYKSCIQVLRDERLSAERRDKIRMMTEQALTVMRQQGDQLQIMIDLHYKNRQQVFERSLHNLDICTSKDDLELFTKSLNEIAVEMGRTLAFKGFGEFDQFMRDKNSVLEF